MPAAFLSIKKQTGAGIVQKAAAHNLREIQAELGADSHIDAARTCQNIRLAGPGTAVEVAEFAETLMADLGAVVTRKDTVRAVEVLVSLPGARAAEAMQQFFGDALEWVRSHFGCPVLSAILHLDEAMPHLHVLVLPVVDGKLRGSDLVGGRQQLNAMQDSFHAAVARKHGLARSAPAKRLSRSVRDQAAAKAIRAIVESPELLKQPDVKTALHQIIASDPEVLLAALGLEMPKGRSKKQRTFAEIMTKPCPEKPKSRLRNAEVTQPVTAKTPSANPIGFDTMAAANPIGFGTEKEQTLSCVGFGISTAPKPQPQPPVEPMLECEPVQLSGSAIADDAESVDESWQRVRDNEPGAVWCEETGEFVTLPVKRTGRDRQAVIAEASRLAAKLAPKRHKEAHVRF